MLCEGPAVTMRRAVSAVLVVHEQRQQQNDRQRDTEQPQQRTSSKAHVSLHENGRGYAADDCAGPQLCVR